MADNKQQLVVLDAEQGKILQNWTPLTKQIDALPADGKMRLFRSIQRELSAPILQALFANQPPPAAAADVGGGSNFYSDQPAPAPAVPAVIAIPAVPASPINNNNNNHSNASIPPPLPAQDAAESKQEGLGHDDDDQVDYDTKHNAAKEQVANSSSTLSDLAAAALRAKQKQKQKPHPASSESKKGATAEQQDEQDEQHQPSFSDDHQDGIDIASLFNAPVEMHDDDFELSDSDEEYQGPTNKRPRKNKKGRQQQQQQQRRGTPVAKKTRKNKMPASDREPNPRPRKKPKTGRRVSFEPQGDVKDEGSQSEVKNSSDVKKKGKGSKKETPSAKKEATAWRKEFAVDVGVPPVVQVIANAPNNKNNLNSNANNNNANNSNNSSGNSSSSQYGNQNNGDTVTLVLKPASAVQRFPALWIAQERYPFAAFAPPLMFQPDGTIQVDAAQLTEDKEIWLQPAISRLPVLLLRHASNDGDSKRQQQVSQFQFHIGVDWEGELCS
jgi:hypothetical protein